ncbi:hypothetical protein cypCar_00043418 [Cyprinus carpio]|nr:hypothetical protein cypCar_00043418 [Cyprinus carpio]
MEFIKEESEDLKIEETLKHEDTDEHTGSSLQDPLSLCSTREHRTVPLTPPWSDITLPVSVIHHLMPLKEESQEKNEMEEKNQYEKFQDFMSGGKSLSYSQTHETETKNIKLRQFCSFILMKQLHLSLPSITAAVRLNLIMDGKETLRLSLSECTERMRKTMMTPLNHITLNKSRRA